MKKFEFELGEILKDQITGFEGVVMVRAEYFTGCVCYGLCPTTLHDEKPVDWEWIDDSRLVQVKGKRKIVFREKDEESPGGPHPNGPQM